MSKALICSVALAALVVSGVALSAADLRLLPGYRDVPGNRGDRAGWPTTVNKLQIPSYFLASRKENL